MVGDVIAALELLHDCMRGFAKEALEVDFRAISSNIYQLQQQQNPLLALRAKNVGFKLVFCPKFVEFIHKI